VSRLGSGKAASINPLTLDKGFRFWSPPGGRMIVAQQFTAGTKSKRIESVQRAVETRDVDIGTFQSSASQTSSRGRPIPAINRWAIFSRPLNADWGGPSTEVRGPHATTSVPFTRSPFPLFPTTDHRLDTSNNSFKYCCQIAGRVCVPWPRV
jgi:hypothetical protein